MAKKELVQRGERYSKEGENWRISASPNIEPLLLPIGKEVGDLKPLLAADGIIVKLITTDPKFEVYLISPNTLKDIKDSNHPHYTSGDSGRVKGAQMGKTIPIVTLDASRLNELAQQQDGENDKAGVKDAQYIFEGDELDGIPKLLIQQINYTLLQSFNRPVDNFDLWDIQLAGDYSIETLVVETAQSGSKVDLDKLAKLMSGVNERVQILRDDFNIIKDVYYNGKIPPNSGWTNVSKLAEDDTVPNPGKNDTDEQVIFKFGGTTAIQSTNLTTGTGTTIPIVQPQNPPINTTPTGSTGIFSNIRANAQGLMASQTGDSMGNATLVRTGIK
jgi:hypothetical protein